MGKGGVTAKGAHQEDLEVFPYPDHELNASRGVSLTDSMVVILL